MNAAPPMVFVTVGTDHHPFDRLVQWVDDWLESTDREVSCLVQYGTSQRPQHADAIEYMDHDRLVRAMADASVVIAHGGPGTIMDCRRAGRVPIVVPRRHALGEHVDDHQVRFSRRIADLDEIELVDDATDLHDTLARLVDEPRAASVDLDHVTETVQTFASIVDRLVRARPRRLRRRPIETGDL